MDRLEILAAWQDFLREKRLSQGKFTRVGAPFLGSVSVLLTANMISSVSYAENIDLAILQSSSSASASPSTMYPPINVSNTEPAPRTPMLHLSPLQSSTSTTAPQPSHLSAPTTVPPPSHPSAPTTAPPLSRPNAPKQRLTQSNFPFPASMVSNPGIRATVVKRAKPLYKDRPRICRLLGIHNDYHAVMNDYRHWIENNFIGRGQPLNVPYTSRTDTENYELSRSVTNKWIRQYGENGTLSEDIIEALVHCISLDYVRNVPTKAKRMVTKVQLVNCHFVDSNVFLQAGKWKTSLSFRQRRLSSSAQQMPKTCSVNHTPLLTPSPTNAAPTIAAAVATPTTAAPVITPLTVD
ncbi:hypothetical protein BDD12DRAFT_932799 [Trichophaea hybrida]|nr:hypothetical protein BDD12DRAFT_932799 [Trichophaea hybrida]